jgi:hypothetical protein
VIGASIDIAFAEIKRFFSAHRFLDSTQIFNRAKPLRFSDFDGNFSRLLELEDAPKDIVDGALKILILILVNEVADPRVAWFNLFD